MHPRTVNFVHAIDGLVAALDALALAGEEGARRTARGALTMAEFYGAPCGPSLDDPCPDPAAPPGCRITPTRAHYARLGPIQSPSPGEF